MVERTIAWLNIAAADRGQGLSENLNRERARLRSSATTHAPKTL